MTLLLDSDFLIYRACYQKGKDFIQMLDGIDWCVSDIIKQTKADDYRIFLSGSDNFRYEISKDYKSNRPKDKPKYYYELRDYLIGNWGAEVSRGCEADDMCGMNQTEDTILAGEDKDLKTIPGWHYRIGKKWNDNRMEFITEEEAARNFYTQCLTGDAIDNIPGLLNPEKLHWEKPPKFTEATASKVLEGKSPNEMKETVIELYKQIHKDEWYQKFDEACRLLFIRRGTAMEYFEVY